MALALGMPAIHAHATERAQATTGATGQAVANQNPNADASDVYYYFTLGHLQEQQFETNGNSDMALQSIMSYQQALKLDPNSAVIMVRLAEIYAESQRVRDAVLEAQQALTQEPDNVDAHRLLARIYVQSLGDIDSGDVQQANVDKAVTEFQAILKAGCPDSDEELPLSVAPRGFYRFAG